MNTWFKYTNVHPGAKKKLRRCLKPFWNDNLQELWMVLCRKERPCLKTQGNHRAGKRHEFKLAQKQFDREYRKAERTFMLNKQIEIEAVNTSDPKKFWQTLKQLGPSKKRYIFPLKCIIIK